TTSRSQPRRSCRSIARVAPALAEWCSCTSISTTSFRAGSARRYSARRPIKGGRSSATDHARNPSRYSLAGAHDPLGERRDRPCARLSGSREPAGGLDREDRAERGAHLVHPIARAEVHGGAIALELG